MWKKFASICVRWLLEFVDMDEWITTCEKNYPKKDASGKCLKSRITRSTRCYLMMLRYNDAILSNCRLEKSWKISIPSTSRFASPPSINRQCPYYTSSHLCDDSESAVPPSSYWFNYLSLSNSLPTSEVNELQTSETKQVFSVTHLVMRQLIVIQLHCGAWIVDYGREREFIKRKLLRWLRR